MRRRYHTQTVHFTPDPNGSDNWDGEKRIVNDNAFATEIYTDILSVDIDTGLLDKNGNQIFRTEYPNGIGFHAEID